MTNPIHKSLPKEIRDTAQQINDLQIEFHRLLKASKEANLIVEWCMMENSHPTGAPQIDVSDIYMKEKL